MAITVTDVKSPAGDIDGTVWFPSLSSGAVDTLLTGYIADAYTKTEDDDAAELWVYYRAASAVADRLATAEANKTMNLDGQGSKTTSAPVASQLDYWLQKAAGYLAAYQEAVTDEDADDSLSGWSVLRSLRHV